MCKLRFFALILVLSVVSQRSSAAGISESRDNRFGMGLVVGFPTGITGKYWIDGNSAYDIALAWSTIGNGSLYFHGTYLLHEFDLIETSKGRMPVYYGIGGYFASTSKGRLGVRVPIGLSYLFPNHPFDLFLEIVPTLSLIPASFFGLGAGFGGRYYF